MIKGLLFAIAALGVLWLALWVLMLERGKPLPWAPFDMRSTASPKTTNNVVGRKPHANWRRRAR